MIGDPELAALDFQRHYRLPIVHLIDPDRSFERRFNKDGWPFLMVIDPNGELVYQCNNLIDREPSVTRLLEKMKPLRTDIRTRTLDGVTYMATPGRGPEEANGARPCERFSSLAAGPDGRLYLVFTSSTRGNYDVWMRVWDGTAWSEDRPVADTDADEYDATVVVDKAGNAWACWTSNAFQGRYNIFVRQIMGNDANSPPLRVTDAYDDAMHGRMAVDDKGRIWITYYQWQKMGGVSRDKEVYVRRLEGGQLSKEVQVSPKDVPDYEDHTDPAVAAWGDGVLVCWSWDYHKPKGYTQDAESPTIFLCPVGGDLALTRPFAVSGKDIDGSPTVVTTREVVWCAWDSLVWGRERSARHLYVRPLRADGFTGRGQRVSGPVRNLCSPYLAASAEGRLALIWCQTEDGDHWALCRADWNPSARQWSSPKTLRSEGNPSYSSACFDRGGRLWVSYSRQTETGRQVAADCLAEQ